MNNPLKILFSNSLDKLKYIFFNKVERAHKKLYLLFVSVFIFAFLYLILPDENFSGVNLVKETIKQEIIKKKVNKNIDEKVMESFSEVHEPYVPHSSQIISNYDKQEVKEKLDEATDVVKEDVEKDTITPEKIETSLTQKLFDRLYFSVQNATLLGYGDIYPVSNLSKTVVIFQSLLTISLILY
jgi:hypothetical protein